MSTPGTMPTPEDLTNCSRQTWMAVLSQASSDQLASRMAMLDPLPSYRCLRPPETGLTMVRGRAGGTGQVFNLGEMTLTRCVVVMGEEPDAVTGFGYVAGRDKQQAERVAVCDALLQQDSWQAVLLQQVIAPLQQLAAHHRATVEQQTAATQVDFFTMLRGE
ncbi:MAG: phosphonate C-P lyase system protein PhnG [Cyanobacteria bacterium J06627_15]